MDQQVLLYLTVILQCKKSACFYHEKTSWHNRQMYFGEQGGFIVYAFRRTAGRNIVHVVESLF